MKSSAVQISDGILLRNLKTVHSSTFNYSMYHVNKHGNDGLTEKITPGQRMCAWTPVVYLFVIEGKIETYQRYLITSFSLNAKPKVALHKVRL